MLQAHRRQSFRTLVLYWFWTVPSNFAKVRLWSPIRYHRQLCAVSTRRDRRVTGAAYAGGNDERARRPHRPRSHCASYWPPGPDPRLSLRSSPRAGRFPRYFPPGVIWT